MALRGVKPADEDQDQVLTKKSDNEVDEALERPRKRKERAREGEYNVKAW
jgi:hypothetical protein